MTNSKKPARKAKPKAANRIWNKAIEAAAQKVEALPYQELGGANAIRSLKRVEVRR